MAKIYYDRAVRYFDFYIDVLKLKTKKQVPSEEAKRRIELIERYAFDSYKVVQTGTEMMNKLNLNPSIKELGKITLLNHLIPEIYQISKLGINLVDNFHFAYENEDFNTLLRLQMPTVDTFDGIIKYVISHYKTSRLTSEQLDFILTDCLSGLNIYELDSKGKIQILRILLQILQNIKRTSEFQVPAEVKDKQFVKK